MGGSYPQIIVTGDSISQQAFKIGGYGAALVDAVSTPPLRCLIAALKASLKYQGKADVINRGMGG